MTAVLLATDGSDDARVAADRALSMAEERDVPLHVVCVVDERKFGDPALSTSELTTIYADDHAALSVADVAEMAAAQEISVEGDTRHGVPHEVILEYADEIEADVIVVGEHGDHDRHFSGVGRKLRELADCEVVVVAATT